MENSSISHETFQIERIYKAPAESVFAAWGSVESKSQWFVGPRDWTVLKREIDFRVGGEEVLIGRFGDGRQTNYSARFHNIVPNRRIVFVYDMHMSSAPHSVSLASVEIDEIDRGRTRLLFTEQVAFLDGTPAKTGGASRKEGTAAHLDRLAKLLDGGALQ